MEYLFLLLIICIIVLVIINSKNFGVQKVQIKTKPLNIDVGSLSVSQKLGDKATLAKATTDTEKKLLQPSEISSISENTLTNKMKPQNEIKIKSANLSLTNAIRTNDLFYLKGSKESQVYHIYENAYTFKEAQDKCSKNNARLATKEELKDVFDNGGYWCSWGWASDGHAYLPNKDTKCNENIGLLSGENIDPYLKLGVNCFGVPI